MRLDVYLADKKMVKSREKAHELIINGGVEKNGRICLKPSAQVTDEDIVKIVGELPRYVGRGGEKLAKALKVFGISVEDKKCVDIGASTGGFTDCLLQNKAASVYAVDVGHGQLDDALKNDPRVIDMEGTDIRTLTADTFGGCADFVCCDVSFISLSHIFPIISDIMSENGCAAVLVKPQFECGRADIGKNGIVRSHKVHERVLMEIICSAGSNGLGVYSLDHSPICGGDGNIEYLAYIKHGMAQCAFEVGNIVDSAFSALGRKGKPVK